jgi:hypothetical protein
MPTLLQAASTSRSRLHKRSIILVVAAMDAYVHSDVDRRVPHHDNACLCDDLSLRNKLGIYRLPRLKGLAYSRLHASALEVNSVRLLVRDGTTKAALPGALLGARFVCSVLVLGSVLLGRVRGCGDAEPQVEFGFTAPLVAQIRKPAVPSFGARGVMLLRRVGSLDHDITTVWPCSRESPQQPSATTLCLIARSCDATPGISHCVVFSAYSSTMRQLDGREDCWCQDSSKL